MNVCIKVARPFTKCHGPNVYDYPHVNTRARILVSFLVCNTDTKYSELYVYVRGFYFNDFRAPMLDPVTYLVYNASLAITQKQ